ncbi:MAG TPA: LysM peptidoglycan-binding domain-containing protein [Candidatus Eisenbacteria bacterium]|nr:LysM peptidoglycan-binding domain-containing protein [Candidatus Eisenbacteria bacterium]
MTARRVGAALAILAAVGTGCGKPVLRVADASLGDYYTQKEYQRLSDEQREEYCRELAEQRDLFREQIEGAQEAIDALHETTGPLRSEVDSLTVLAEELERRLAEAKASAGTRGTRVDAGAEPPPKAPSDRHVVRPGESLWSISSKPDVYGEGARWNRLYRSNKERIRDPNRIYPGQEIQIPR